MIAYTVTGIRSHYLINWADEIWHLVWGVLLDMQRHFGLESCHLLAWVHLVTLERDAYFSTRWVPEKRKPQTINMQDTATRAMKATIAAQFILNYYDTYNFFPHTMFHYVEA